MKKTLLVLIMLSSLLLVKGDFAVQSEIELTAEKLQALGLDNIETTPCIVYSDTHCRVEDMNSATGDIIRIDVPLSFSEAERQAYIDSEVELQLNDYAEKLLEPKQNQVSQLLGNSKSYRLVEEQKIISK